MSGRIERDMYSKERVNADAFNMASLEENLERAESSAALRREMSFGRLFSNSPLHFIVAPPDKNRSYPADTSTMEPHEIIDLAISLRRMIEWPVWSPETSYPHVKDDSGPGKSLGQCLVSSRFAMNYIRNAKLVEVRVKSKEGKEVGPHVVLEIPVEISENNVVICYLDISHDQSLALGDVPRFLIDADPRKKINLSVKDSKECPYIFVRYQPDKELKDKRTKPLDHSSLVFEKVAFRNAHPKIQGIERYARDIGNDMSLVTKLFGQDISDKITLASALLTPKSTFDLSARSFFKPKLQLGLIELSEYLPSPEWLWEVSGLRGFSEAVIFNEGFTQEQLFFSGDSILIVNLAGGYTPAILRKVVDELRPDNEKFRPLLAPSVLDDFAKNKSITGPIFVKEKN